MRIEAIELIRVELELETPMLTSHDLVRRRPVLFVRVVTDAGEGFGECSALESPTYTEEYLSGAAHVLEEVMIPLVLAAHPASVDETMRSLAGVRGNAMARAALEMAVLDADLRAKRRSLASFLGAKHDKIAAGVTFGIDEPEAVVKRASDAIASGFERVKCKIAPGRDVAIVRALREKFPDLVICADANGAYHLDDAQHLAALDAIDEFGLAAIEQPLAPRALAHSAWLADRLSTPILLDESVASGDDLDLVLHFGSGDAISIKPARLGGLMPALAVIERARDAGLGLCIGGMYETGIGRASAIALGALEGVELPSDLGPSDRYFRVEVSEPHVLEAGFLAVPNGPGLGRTPRAGIFEYLGAKRTTFRPS
jgi:O-succinylbenzoate synthase